jgi:hypothetical protein
MSSSAKQLTYKEAMDAHAREYLKATGGERQRAAEMAGLNRTHLQALIKRFGISIDFDPKARGRRRKQGEPVEKSDEAAAPQIPVDPIRF